MSTYPPTKSHPARPEAPPIQAIALGLNEATFASRPRPRIEATSDVLVKILAAGLCRTDLYVASGELPAAPGVILGHEAAGTIQELGPHVRRGDLSIGGLVGIDPRVPCMTCAACSDEALHGPSPDRCLTPRQLGVDLDGVFAEYAAIPSCCLYPIAGRVSALRAAYLEPVAAAMGALTAGLTTQDVGVIAGEGRIAELTARVLEYSGYSRPQVISTEAFHASLTPGTLDFVIDAGLPSDHALSAMTGALRKGGTLVLKSRTAQSRSFVPAGWVAREITVAARSYGPFQDAARAVADERLVLEDLFGSARPLSAHQRVFSDARAAESVKQFFGISPETISGAHQAH